MKNEKNEKEEEGTQADNGGGGGRSWMRWLLIGIGYSIGIVGILLCLSLILPTGDQPINNPATPDQALMAFADCLSDRNFTVAYSDGCGACTMQKEMFGVAFANLSSVDCGSSAVNCSGMGIRAIPIWISGDTKEYHEGVLTIQKLAEWSGCECGEVR